ncbi:MAG: hypothetical protein A2991_04245 [Candidatus Terrybacteria bacterium RIFCSPLOWO2_01_FULL_58_14]|uniref:Uncharacterized protein n=2 Tax=Candidatus Terryibacteriota TaxID=1817920 RepID=A0A1G2PW01_9BACT|nr:MAG: hypothetical protein A2682_03395 [Candidatus Terrybacteria bacterium RIFCSPHIGHO2_01_FULL_58_15]OHA52506.1 MAG: hypothetical protein A2991_04245 [Candidatus Terrybacteria bacterium RIFCSPLOWO2_01_FULL_58_14]
MGLALAAVLLWPFLIFAVGLVFVVFSDAMLGGPGPFFGMGMGLIFWLLPFALLWFVFSRNNPLRAKARTLTASEQLETVRRYAAIFSIALLLPIFVRYIVEFTDKSLAGVILGLVLGFGLAVWGMFLKGHHTIMYANILGGALVLLYVYTQLWALGEAARVIAAGFGLVVAIGIAVVKLKDKLA